ncbi:glycosyltransferase family 2 protein [Propionivibrio sp.]|uniref:glycosyltransferase family 2 protein n=1 Tax=Propionivibrio sp. TaxID=2212460 RepID=UPI003BF40044
MKLQCVVLNWKDAPATIRCVQSLLAQDVAMEEILIVDNASDDGSVTILQAAFPEIAIVVSEINLGFAGGMNLGARTVLARSDEDDALLFLNNDALVMTNLYPLLWAARQPGVGLVSPLIVSEQNTEHIEFQGSAYDWKEPRIIWYNDEISSANEINGLINSPRLSGAALVVSVDVIHKIGMFDESFFMYFEDDELSARSLKAGLRNVVARNAVLSHTGKSAKSAPPHYIYYMKRNEFHFWHKYLPFSVWLSYFFRLWAEGFGNLSDPNYSNDQREAVKDGLWSVVKGCQGPWSNCSRPKLANLFFSYPVVSARLAVRISYAVKWIMNRQSRGDL